MIGSVLRTLAVLLSLTWVASLAFATGVNDGDAAQVQQTQTYSLGVAEDEAPTVNWGRNTGQPVFEGSSDVRWLDGVIEGVAQSVMGFSERNTGFLSDGLLVGSIKLDSALFSYGDSVDKTATLLSALDTFAQDFSAVVPLPAMVPLILLVMAAIVLYRRNRR